MHSRLNFAIIIGNKIKQIGRDRKLGMTNKIKALCAIKGIGQKELAELLDVSQPVLSKKYKLDNWRESDLQEIAKVLNVEYKGIFVLNNGETI